MVWCTDLFGDINFQYLPYPYPIDYYSINFHIDLHSDFFFF
jgi:hypothetical protein